MRLTHAFLFCALSVAALCPSAVAAQTAPPAPASELNLRVLIASKSSLELEIPFQHGLYYPDGKLLYQSETAVKWPLGLTPGGNVTVNGTDSGTSKLYIPEGARGSVMALGAARYRGGMLVRAVKGKLQLINVVNLEDYLYGVVPAEMPPGWPLEALKAQAVIARTYAIAHLSPGADYDLCATQQCQVYPGVAKESALSSLAVEQTRGQIVAWGGKPALTYFSSDNGGWTASASEVWGMNVPYLGAQPDPFSRSPRSQWQLELLWSKVSNIASGYAKLGTLKEVSVSRYSNSGRPLEIALSGSGGKATLKGAEAGGFVKALGGYSTRVAFGSNASGLSVAGAGFGHGVGLSQYGAQGMAQRGYDYLSIMGFYFPKAGIGQYVLAGDGQGKILALSLPPHTAPRTAETPSSVFGVGLWGLGGTRLG